MDELATAAVDGSGKWAALTQLGTLCVAMLLGAFGSGIVPLYVSLSSRQLNLFNALGAGLLLGTALAVILPEGIHELYEAGAEAEEEHSAHHGHEGQAGHEHGLVTNESIVGVALLSGFLLMLMLDNLSCCGGSHMHGHSHLPAPVPQEDTKDLSDLGLSSSEYEPEDCADVAEGSGLVEMRSMQGGQGGSSPLGEREPDPETGGQGFRRPGSDASHGSSCSQPNTLEAKKKRATVTVGLLVHAAMDGLALGATKAGSDGSSFGNVELVVFFAIMMHKVPAAFAMTLYLRKSGQDTAGIRRNLLSFSLAAPAGALAIFFLLHKGFLGLGSVSEAVIGFGLLFSGGTFLYVAAVHALQELPRRGGTLDARQLAALTLGCFVPVVLSAGHEH